MTAASRPTEALRAAPLRAPAGETLAAGEAMLARAVAGVRSVAARVIAPPALVVGSGQRLDTIDAEACARAGLPIVRRGSGGGAVRCDGTVLQVDVALPPSDPQAVADVVQAYAWFGAAWQAALAQAGIAARLVGIDEARAQTPLRRAAARAACWAGISPFEVLTGDGRKLVGLAQRRRRGAVLHQAAVACGGSPASVLALLVLEPEVHEEAAAALARTAALGDLDPSLATPEAAWARLGPVLLGRLR